MMLRAIFLAFPLIAAHAQTWQLGTPGDPCTGGYTLTLPSGATLRYGAFACAFNTPQIWTPGIFLVRLEFQEPGVTVAGKPVFTSGARVFNVFVNDQPFLWNFDLVAAGATNSTITRSRAMIAATVDGIVNVRVVPVVGSGRLSRVIVSPYAGGDFVPYSGATKDVDLGGKTLKASTISTTGTGPSSLSFHHGTCPAKAEPGFDSTLCVEADGVVYMVDTAGGKRWIGQR